MMKTFKTQLGAVALCGIISAGVVQSSLASNLVANGGFEINGGNGQIGFNTSATGWSLPPNSGYAFLFAPGTSDTTGAVGQFGALSLWGPGTGSNNGLPATSPQGGYFMAMDSDFQSAALSQTITGLTVGKNYTVKFHWAAAQQAGFNGDTTEGWHVSLGAATQSTSVYSNPSHGFSGWMPETMTFQATSTSDLLSFLAYGTPGGPPPFSLLDGVSLQSVPDTNSTVILFGLGLVAVVVAPRLRRQH